MLRGAPIALFWFFYFGALGIFFPYYSLYLRENAGLSGTETGIVLSAIPLVGLVAQPFWGNVADRTGVRSIVLALLSLCTSLAYANIGRVDGFAGLLMVTALLASVSTAVIPMSISVALATFESMGPHAFGLARVWGTLGYLITVAGFPRFLAWWGRDSVVDFVPGVSEPLLGMMFIAIAIGVGTASATAWLIPRGGSVERRAESGDWRELGRLRPFLMVALVAFAAFVFLQGPMALFPILVRSRGGDMKTVGDLWVIMLLLEVPLIALSGAGLQRVGARGLLFMGIASGGLRWLGCAFAPTLGTFYAVQILHGITVMGLMVGGPLYLEQVVPEHLRSTSQNVFAMMGIGAGGLVSNVLTGWLMDNASVELPYVIGGIGALVLAACLRWILPRV